MPYCDACSKYWTPSSLPADGRCPRCGAELDGPHAHGDVPLPVDGAAAEKVPWHFKLMVVALVVYLVWRFVQLGVEIFT